MKKRHRLVQNGWVRRVRTYLAAGKERYRMAAAQIDKALKNDPKLTQKIVALRVQRSETWVSRLLSWYREGCPEESIFGGEHSWARAATRRPASPRGQGLDQEYVNGKLMRDGRWVQQSLPVIGGPVIEAPPIAPHGDDGSDAAARFLEALGIFRRLRELLEGLSRDAMIAACGGTGKEARTKLEAFGREAQAVERITAIAADEARAAL